MADESTPADGLGFLSGGGETGALMRAHDWAATPLGPPEGWPQPLRAAVGLMLTSGFPMFVAWGRRLTYLYNDPCAQLIGAKHPAAFGADFLDVWPEHRPSLAPLVESALAGEAAFHENQPFVVDRSGVEEEAWFTFSYSPLRCDEGRVAGFFCAVTETTQAVLAGRHAAAERERLAAMFEQAPGFMTLLGGPDHVFEMVNASYRQLLGHRDMIGLPLREALPEVEGQGFFELMDRVYATGEPFIGRALPISLQRTPDAPSEERILDFIYQPIAGKDGAVSGIFVEGLDVTDRARQDAALRASEARYRMLFEAMGQGYALVELVRNAGGEAIDQRYLEFNPAVERLLGVSRSDAVGKLGSQVFPGMEPYWTDTFDRVVRNRTPGRIEQFFSPLGRWFEINAYPAGDDRFIALYDDITERKRAEAALRESEERQAFLLRLSDALRAEPSADAIANRALRMLLEQMRLDRCYIGIYRLAEDIGDFPNQVHDDRLPPLPAQVRLSDFPEALQAAFDGTLVIEDVVEMEGLSDGDRASFDGLGMRALIAATLRKGESNPLWAIVAVSTCPRVWTQGEVSLVEEVAERTWAAVERTRAETARADSEERLRAIVETARDYAILTTDPEGRIETWSRGAEEVLGWSADEIVGKMMDVTFTPEDRAEGIPAWERRTARDEGQASDVRWHLRKDGTRVFIEGAVRPLASPDGSPRGFVKVGQDVTERRATQEALRASEALFRQFAEASSDVLWIRDAARLQFEYVSPAFEAIYGDTFERVFAGNDLRRWARTILPEDRGSALDAFRRVGRGERVNHEFRIRRVSDGALRWIRDTDFPILDEAGRVERVAGIGQDVTHLKRAEAAVAESEARLRVLTEGIPQLVWRAVDHGEWAWASPQWTAFTGQAEAASHGWGWLDALHPDDRLGAREAWERSRVTNEFEAEYRLREGATGEHRWFQSRATQVRDETGRLVEWLGTTTDVQVLKELQARQEVMVAELQHRTRNLITVVRSLARQTTAGTGSVEAFREAFDSRLEALSRVQGLLSRAEQEPITLRTLLTLEFEALGAPEGERATLDGPTVRLRPTIVQTLALALHELGTNARKYGALSEGGGRLGVRWRFRGGDEGRRVHIEWREEGLSRATDAAEPSSGRQGGYGRRLIEQALPYALGAQTTYELGLNELRCTIDLPLDRPNSIEST